MQANLGYRDDKKCATHRSHIQQTVAVHQGSHNSKYNIYILGIAAEITYIGLNETNRKNMAATTTTTMKVLDKIASYEEKRKQQETEQPSNLPALSLEFFPPRTQDGVVVRTIMFLSSCDLLTMNDDRPWIHLSLWLVFVSISFRRH